ncbi:glycosyl transferase family protein [mine drainage metagenome]|uniref:Glycosyl transferase family protein n=1 Tax=mine drainage metagenome TaxID=410659 RepID=T0ZJI2_9ZZZZ
MEVHVGLLGFLAVIFGIAMFNHGLIPAEEPRFAEVVREMIARSSFWVPLKNGLPYVEYPPLYYWLAIPFRLMGLPLRAAIRVPGTLAFLAWIIWMRRWMQTLFPSVASTLPLLALAALPIALYNFFTAHTDSLLALGVLMAYTGYARHRTGRVRGFPWELWLGVLLATSAKGPVGMAITLPGMGLEMLLADSALMRFSKDAWIGLWKRIRAIRPFRGLALAVSLIVVWYVVAGLEVNWDFVRAALIYQNFTRFLTGLDHEHGPWLYFHTIWGDFFPWSLLLPFGLVAAWRLRAELPWRLALTWALWTVFFFSLSVSKQSKYILPAAPAIVLLSLGGLVWLFGGQAKRARRVAGTVSLSILTLFAFLAILVLPGLIFPGLIPVPKTVQGLSRLRAYLEKHPAPLVSYLYPRPPTIYALYPLRHAPIPFVRSARALYAEIHSGVIRPGSYLLVYRDALPAANRKVTSRTLSPPPNPRDFARVFSIPAQGGLILYRLLPTIRHMPVPKTPQPPPWHWWDQFDTD